MNDDLFYQDGYKMMVTNQGNELIDYEVVDIDKNYRAIELRNRGDLFQGEKVKIAMTPALEEGIFASTHSSQGYTMNYIVSDMGQTPECRFSLSMTGDFTSVNGDDDEVYVELVTVQGKSKKISADETLFEPCFYMTGGSARLMRKSWLADEEIMSFPLQYVNGVEVEISLTKDAAEIEPSVFEPVQQMFSKFAGSFTQ